MSSWRSICSRSLCYHGHLHRQFPLTKVYASPAASSIYLTLQYDPSWPGENVSGQTKRAVAVAMQVAIGDLGVIAGQVDALRPGSHL